VTRGRILLTKVLGVPTEYIKVKSKAVPQHTLEVQGERRYSSYSFMTSELDGMSGQRHAPATLYPRGKDLRYPLNRRLGGLQSRAGHRG
jgi:hypothetical protein